MTVKFEVDYVREILEKYPEAYAKILDDGEVNDNEKLYDELFEYFLEDMPYGTAKARDGDPVEWITMRLEDLGLLETVLEEDGMGFQIRGFREQDEVEISDEEQERANHIAKSQDRGEM